MNYFIDLMADVRWSEQDIVNRMEAEIRSHCSAVEELILHRKMLGAGAGMYVLSLDEQAEIGAYAQVCADAQVSGRIAREDMALLEQALALEALQLELDAQEDPLEVERIQAEIDAAPAEVTTLVAQRAVARAPADPPADEQPQDTE